MAYKFQIGAARLSGSLTQEGAVTAESAALSGSTLTTKTGGLSIGGVAVTATPAELNLLDGVAGLVQNDFTKLAAIDADDDDLNKLNGFGAATYAAADSVVFLDADTNTLKSETAQDFAVFLGAHGLTASAGKLRILTDAGNNGAAQFNVSTDGISLKTQIAHDGLNMESGLLKVQVTGAASLVGSDGSKKVGIATSIAGDGLAASGSSNATHTLSVNVDASTIEINSDTLRLKDGGTTLAKLADAGANTVIVRDANSSGVLSAKTVGNQQLLIGDGTGFTAATLSGDVATLSNAGAVTLAAAQTNITSIINSSLGKIGTDAAQEYIDFGTANQIHFVVNDTPVARATDGTFIVDGNLTVNGTTTSVNSTTLLVEDALIELNVVTGSEGRASNSGAGFFISGSSTDKEASLLLTADGGKFKASGSAGGGFDVAVGGGYAINGTTLLSATALHANVLVDGDSLRINNCDASLTSANLATDDLLIVHDDDASAPKKITAGNLRTFFQTGVTATSTQGFAFNQYNTGSAAQSLAGTTGFWGANSSDGSSANAVVLHLSGTWSNGNVVIIKAPNNAGAAAGNRKLTIAANVGSGQTIDGENSILLESDSAAVTLVYGSDNWNIV